MSRLPFPRLTSLFLLLCSAGLATAPVLAQTTLTIDLSRPALPVNPKLYGLMTEEINYSYDGGLYAEQIRNRIFKDDARQPVSWELVQGAEGRAAMALDEGQPIAKTALTTSLKLDATRAAPGQRVGVANGGYWGIAIRPATTYRASFYVKTDSAAALPLKLTLESPDGKTVYAEARVTAGASGWRQYTATLKTGQLAPTSAARFVISTEKPATLWLNLVSLFPPTYQDRANGNRPDVMKLLVDMKPGFLRLPGGNYLEGDTIATRFQWKQTLGPLDQRPGHPGTWKYRSSDGMGLMEYLLWCEDMGAEPLLAVFAGYALKKEYIPGGPGLQPYVDEALDEIEYVIGDTSTKWGAQRARDGHPKPFPLTYVEIGNEDGFEPTKTYDSRYTQFHDAIKARYPHLKLISTVNGKDGLGQRQSLTSRVPDLVDEHYYKNAMEMMSEAHRYDSYDRKGPKVLVGEWATREGAPTTNLIAAIGDAAWMTGMERNVDVVELHCYAPLFVNVNPGGMQWKSNLIGYDVMNSYGSPAYHVQKMFSTHIGNASLAVQADKVVQQTWQPAMKKDGSVPAARQVPSMFFSATRADKTGEIYLKVVNALGSAQTVAVELKGAVAVQGEGTAITLKSAEPTDTNSISDPVKIVPVSSKATGLGKQFGYTFAPYSVTVLVLKSR